jgi:hypothetical protein
MALLNFGFQMAPTEGRINRDRERLLKLLTENQMVTAPQMGPERPGEVLGDITARQQGTSLLPEAPAGAVASLIANPQTRQIGQSALMNLINRAFPGAVKPSSNIAEYQQAIELGLVDPKTTYLDFRKASRAPAVSIDMSSHKPLGDDATKWRNTTTGEQASPLDTPASANDKGFVPHTTDQIKAIEAGQAAAPLIGGIAQTAFGKEGEGSIFTDDGATTTDRVLSYAQVQAGVLSKDPKFSRHIRYNASKEASLSLLARIGGQTGNLNDRDVQLVRELWPIAGFTPESVAKEQFKEIARFLMVKGITKDQLKKAGLPQWSYERGAQDMTDQELEAIINGN